MRLRQLFIVSVLLISEAVCAQNARFSQIGGAPLLLNPSLSGRFDGQIRAGSLFSWQKTDYADMAHQNVFVDFKIGKYKGIGDEERYNPDTTLKQKPGKKPHEEAKEETEKRSNYKGYWAGGFNFYHYGSDKTPIRANFYTIALARHFYLRNNKYVGLGGSISFADGTVDGTGGKIRNFDKEISGGGFKFDSIIGFNRVGRGGYTDFNIGAYFGMVTEQLSFEAGVAMSHLFYPHNDIILNQDDAWLRHRLSINTVVRFKVAPHWAMVQKNVYLSEGLYWKSRTFNDNLYIVSLYSGVEFYRTQPQKYCTLNFGMYTRSFRTIMPIINLGFGKSLSVRFSYEFPVNSTKFNAYTASRTEAGVFYNFKKRTPTGQRMYNKLNYW